MQTYLSGEDIVGDPLHEISTVLVLHILHLLLDLFHRHLASEVRSDLNDHLVSADNASRGNSR